MNPEEIQKRIEKNDRELLVLLQERIGLALREKRFREGLDDLRRKNDLPTRAPCLNHNLIQDNITHRLLGTIADAIEQWKEEDQPLTAFQGEHGAYSEVAARKLVPDGAFLPCHEFGQVFRGVENGDFDLGVVPVENSLEGAVTHVNDLLTTTTLNVIGEVSIAVNHCLLAAEATDYREIRQVFSHPQALAQCRDFLIRNNLEPRPYYDTAGAARMLTREAPRAAAAIASSLCAKLYSLEILQEGIEDSPSNVTRFLLLAREQYSGTGDKTSIIFSVPHEIGRLYAVLKLFADAQINLTRIASMPLRSDPGNYSFFLDFEGSEQDGKIAEVLHRLQGLTQWMKCLGSYPADRTFS